MDKEVVISVKDIYGNGLSGNGSEIYDNNALSQVLFEELTKDFINA